jgi:hypothetical protein
VLTYSLAGFALVMVVAFLRRVPDKYDDFCFGAMLPVMGVLLMPLRIITSWISPVTIDLPLRQLDVALGLDGFALTRFLLRVHLYAAVPIVYFLLPIAVALAWSIERPKGLMRDLVLGAFCAIPFFYFFPACGPSHAFPDFPWSAAKVLPVIGSGYPRNCVPSMHFGWAMLLALNCRRWWAKILFWTFAALTAIAAVAGGEHYFIDIIAAVPFTFAVQWVARLRWEASKSPIASTAR